MRQTEHTKVSAIQTENRLNPLPICQMYQARIGELYPQAPILTENRANSGKVWLVQRKKLKRPALERGHQHPEGRRIFPQKPGRLGEYGPTSQQRSPDPPKLLYALSMVFVGRREDGHDRAGVNQ